MRIPIVLLLLVSALFMVGCGNSSQPLISGTVSSGTMWDGPPGLGSRSGMSLVGAHVDIYEHVIVATTSEGQVRVAPVEWCSQLVLKK